MARLEIVKLTRKLSYKLRFDCTYKKSIIIWIRTISRSINNFRQYRTTDLTEVESVIIYT